MSCKPLTPTFDIGQVVFCAVPNESGYYEVMKATVTKIYRGVVTLTDFDNNVFECGLACRRLAFTFGECGYVCAILNMNRSKSK